jgi:hypothetical protein
VLRRTAYLVLQAALVLAGLPVQMSPLLELVVVVVDLVDWVVQLMPPLVQSAVTVAMVVLAAPADLAVLEQANLVLQVDKVVLVVPAATPWMAA